VILNTRLGQINIYYKNLASLQISSLINSYSEENQYRFLEEISNRNTGPGLKSITGTQVQKKIFVSISEIEPAVNTIDRHIIESQSTFETSTRTLSKVRSFVPLVYYFIFRSTFYSHPGKAIALLDSNFLHRKTMH